MLQKRALTLFGSKRRLYILAARCFFSTESASQVSKNTNKFELVEMSGWSRVVLTPDPSTSLAHCVSADFDMSDGIAKKFKKKFGNYQDLVTKGLQFQEQGKVGDIAVLERNESSFVYYLITRENWWDHATPSSLRACLMQLRKHSQENRVDKLAIPRLGTGADRIDWPFVKRIVEEVFKETDISITAYTYR
ncbi:O-acetyl-ADP-ribose deacetylase 1-like [Stylophora pistillata]|uniref:O-acetyl-ADP-ribose deacetylase 1 n=1 Tax=Stylophora pistillata TaxID=50429 RepID=A0A2B4RC13_STYPI|nr:O-acetyl-ADP-ribose deacetylase 1-like [Stylophora pistillata]XP_022808430.1 O-acetyl-ADP-ribose deacetylase 1-like [Stylophora pistillata]XP_022808431.1 O-acetyl-ADP-ribose deacetylase 1-like [Stylophora pistillata]PFX13928.1 O-acetyl-ADP-ribose deacetylase 1 [Stylophora pistillata]